MEKLLKKIYKNTFKVFFPSAGEILERILIDELKDATRVLDLGCGYASPLGRVKDKLRPDLHSVGVDNFLPYLNQSREKKIHSEYIQSNIFEVEFPPKSFDAAILLDVIEHFERKEFLNFLPKLEKIAKKIIIMTPNGFVYQEEYDGNEYQVHKSGWTVKDMENLGFKCLGLSGLKYLRGELSVTRIRPIFLGNMISNLTEPLVYNKPASAYHLVCIKKTE